MKSIIHDKDSRTCYLCATVKFDYSEKTNLEEHHIFGGNPNRRLSEKYGLKVYLCPEHHRTSNEAVHRPDRNWYQRSLQITGQKYFETYYPHLDFVKIFGRNYYTEDDK